jgi:hypothetical protein
MTDPRDAPFGAVLLTEVVQATDIDPDYPDATGGEGVGSPGTFGSCGAVNVSVPSVDDVCTTLVAGWPVILANWTEARLACTR